MEKKHLEIQRRERKHILHMIQPSPQVNKEKDKKCENMGYSFPLIKALLVGGKLRGLTMHPPHYPMMPIFNFSLKGLTMLNMTQNVNISDYMFEVVNAFPYIANTMEIHYRNITGMDIHYRTLHELSSHI